MGGLLRALDQFCADIGADQHKPNQRWMADMLKGMTIGRSPMLSEIGRALEEVDEDGEPRRLIHTEKRLSRGLNSDRFDDDALLGRHLVEVARWTRKDRGEGVVMAVDYTDLAKPYADLDDGMQGVGWCWNGSDHEVGIGYPVVQIEADTGAAQIPVILRPFSYQDKNFVEGSQTLIFLEQIALAAPYIGARAWWTADRGFDNGIFFDGLDALGLRWVIRLQYGIKRQRSLYLEDGRELRVDAAALEAGRAFKMQIKAGRKRTKGSGKNVIDLEIGAMKVFLEDRKTARTLVVVWGFGKEPVALLASEYASDKDTVLEMARAYGRRWKCEEQTRAIKDSRGWGVDLEDVRALTLRGIQRIALLTILLYTFLASVRGMGADIVKRLLDLAPSFGVCPADPIYRMFRGLGELLRRARWRRVEG